MVFLQCTSPPTVNSLATGSFNKSINLYSFNEGNAILAHKLEGHTSSVNSLSFSPDCKLLCSGTHQSRPQRLILPQRACSCECWLRQTDEDLGR